MRVYELGEEGGAWLVAGTESVERARLEVIKWLGEIFIPTAPNGDPDIYSLEVAEALNTDGHVYRFVVGDESTEKVYHSAAPGITPHNAYENGASWFGSCVALGTTIPAWPKDDKVIVDVEIFGDTGSSHTYFFVTDKVATDLHDRYDNTIYAGNGLSDIVYIHIDVDNSEAVAPISGQGLIDIEWYVSLREVGSM